MLSNGCRYIFWIGLPSRRSAISLMAETPAAVRAAVGGAHCRASGLFQEYVDRRVRNAHFLIGLGLVAAVVGRHATGRSHADDRLCLSERARSFTRFGVEQKPGNGLVDWRRHARLYLADHLAAIEPFPGRSGIVLADGLVLRIKQLCVRSP